jgi:CMP-N,N'-diacetyllegionaminic acid synthase
LDKIKTVCFDIDGVLCSQVEHDYADAAPNREMIALVNSLYDSGVRIVLHTSRFMGRAKGDADEARRLGLDFTRRQLESWGLRYHELFMGKPRYDLLVDDRSIFYKPDVKEIAAQLASMQAPRDAG